MAQARQDPALHDLHPDLDLGLVFGFIRARRDHGHAVVRGHRRIGGIQVRFVAAGARYPGPEIVGDEERGHAADEVEQTHVRTDPVGELLGPGGLGVGVVAGPEHGDEDLGGMDLTRSAIDDRYGLAGIVDEQFLAGAVALAQGAGQGITVRPVVHAELGVAVGVVRVNGTVFLPQELQGDAFFLELLVHHGPIGGRVPVQARGHVGALAEQACEGGLVLVLG